MKLYGTFWEGYNWVLDELGAQRLTIEEIEDNIRMAKDLDFYTDFDRGAEQALITYRERERHERSRND
jgi:hypothetical protein